MAVKTPFLNLLSHFGLKYSPPGIKKINASDDRSVYESSFINLFPSAIGRKLNIN